MTVNSGEPSLSLKRVSLVLVAIGAFLIPFMGSSLSLALPLIQNDLFLNILMLGWIPTAFVLANAALVLPFGRLADIHGRKKIFTYGIIIYTLASLLAGFSTSGITLLFFSFLQGVGCALIFATGVALLISIFPLNRRGEVLGIYITAVYLGLFFGPLLGGFLAQNWGWRSIFFINVPLGLFALTLILTKFKGEWKSSEGEKFDLVGSLIYIFSLSVTMYGFSTLHDLLGKILFVTGLIGLVLFFIVEKKSSCPVIPLDIFKNRVTSFSALSLLLINIATSAMWTLLSLYLQDLRGLDTLTTALIMAVQPLAVALLSPLVGRTVDKNDNRIINIIGALFCTIGLLNLALLDINTSLFLVLTGLLLVGVGMGLFSTPTTRNVLASLTDKFYGIGSASLSTLIYIGQTLSLGVLLFILTGYMGDVQIVPGNYHLFIEGLHVS
ncbi:MAG: MFS transporter, partial [Methanobacterium sp.]|nr:MFS transporter [Methanobacterium sp.]